jgi:hypothetical protein
MEAAVMDDDVVLTDGDLAAIKKKLLEEGYEENEEYEEEYEEDDAEEYKRAEAGAEVIRRIYEGEVLPRQGNRYPG